MQQLPKNLKQKMADRQSEKAWRTLETPRGLIDFSSNDYLGFARNETLFSKTFQRLLSENISHNGATGSRLISGNHKLYPALEALLAQFHRSESALAFNSGYDANIGFFSAVPQRGDLVFYDEFVHASIRDGIRLGKAKSFKYGHNQLEDLKEAVARNKNAIAPDGAIYIVTEAVFSMDGDTPDLVALAQWCAENGCLLVVDEAHATGIMGKNGEGAVVHLGLQEQVFARIVTFGKALGCHGAAILGTTALKEYLVNFARSFIYTTALTPHSLTAVISAYTFLQEEGAGERKMLQKNIAYFKKKMENLGLASHFLESSSPIQSCKVPGNAKVLKVSDHMLQKGFFVKAIRSPSVPKGSERLRFCLHSTNTQEEMGLALELLAKRL